MSGDANPGNVIRRNGVDLRSYWLLFAPNGVTDPVDVYDPGDVLVNITRTGVGAYLIVYRAGVAPSAAVAIPVGGFTTGGYQALGVSAYLRTTVGALGGRACVAGVPTFDSAGRLNVTLTLVNAAGAATEFAANAAAVCEVIVNADEGKL